MQWILRFCLDLLQIWAQAKFWGIGGVLTAFLLKTIVELPQNNSRISTKQFLAQDSCCFHPQLPSPAPISCYAVP